MGEIMYLNSGRNRAVYRHGNYVIKVPLNEKGLHDNFYERRTYLRVVQAGGNGASFIKYARCRLLGGILVMEYVEPVYKNLPDWADYVDCQQVGRARDGSIVAYDYGWF